jgi:hypothetical protein
MGKFNNCLVLILAQLVYIFMGMEPDQELKYSVGWAYDGISMLMVGANLAIVVKAFFQGVVLKFKFYWLRCQKRCKTPSEQRETIYVNFELAKIVGVDDIFFSPRIIPRIKPQIEAEVVASWAIQPDGV